MDKISIAGLAIGVVAIVGGQILKAVTSDRWSSRRLSSSSLAELWVQSCCRARSTFFGGESRWRAGFGCPLIEQKATHRSDRQLEPGVEARRPPA